MRIDKKLLLIGLASLCLLAGAPTQAHAGRQRAGASADEPRFELARPEKMEKGRKGKNRPEAHATPAPTYKPIRGVRLAVPNQPAKARKESVEKAIRKQKSRNRANKALLKRKRAQLGAYRAVQSSVSGTCSAFVDNGKGNGILRQASFDGFLAGIEDYGVLDAEALLGLCWDCCPGRGRAGSGNGAEGRMECPRMPARQAFGLLYSENYICGARIVDIEPYLSQAVSNSEKEISSLKKALKKGRRSLGRLRKELGQVNTGDIVFNSKDVTEPSNITASQMKEMLAGTELEQYADTYVRIEREYGINAIAICSLSALESRWGTSRRAREDHNYTGYGVYSDSSAGINAASGEENLMMTARHVARNYLPEGGTYYHGKGLDGINRCYAASRTWAYGIEEIGCRLMRRL